MSQTETIIAGVLKADGTLELSEKPKLSPGPVTVVLRQEAIASVPQPPGGGFFAAMQEIWFGQQARGHVSGSATAARRKLREQMDQEIEAAERLQGSARGGGTSANRGTAGA